MTPQTLYCPAQLRSESVSFLVADQGCNIYLYKVGRSTRVVHVLFLSVDDIESIELNHFQIPRHLLKWRHSHPLQTLFHQSEKYALYAYLPKYA